ncbi:hypothetical protein [Streptomyces wuyuanensis]|uniref:hypothetical protein n=1 Tax=Streptomyces wuyuanensis TaxID=1196353 RepID=UPI003710FFBD
MRFLRRLRQCPARTSFELNLQCQRTGGHEGPHKASPSERSLVHYSWTDPPAHLAWTGVTYELLSGTVRYGPDRPATPTVAYRAGEWAVDLVVAVVWWLMWGPAAAIGFLALTRLLSVRRPRFVDVGRFTVGVWPVTYDAPPLIFGIAWLRRGEGRSAEKCGLEVVIGRVVVGAFSLESRKEWKRSRAEFRARQRKENG